MNLLVKYLLKMDGSLDATARYLTNYLVPSINNKANPDAILQIGLDGITEIA